MKNFLRTFIVSALMLIGAASAVSAQNKGNEGWKEKMMSEKIAFITVELNITPEEAQVFWPVYNRIEQQRDEARRGTITAHKAMMKALEEGKPEKEISALLDKYLEAKKRQDEIDNGTAESYKTVLPVEKVARLYVAEEKFRRQCINQLHKGEPSDKRR